MLIRTQDKLTLVNLDQVKEIRILKDCVTKNIKCEFADGTGRFIGAYSTEEKALEVLNLIEMDYMANCKICNMPQEDELCLDKVTETERDLADAMNTINNYNNYKSMLFGGI